MEQRVPMELLGVAALVLAAAMGFMIVAGFPSPRDAQAHPPCDDLPLMSEVEAALRGEPDLARSIEQQGDGVRVEVGRPCADDTAALVEVSYRDADDHPKIEKILTQADGFGVPVTVVQRK